MGSFTALGRALRLCRKLAVTTAAAALAGAAAEGALTQARDGRDPPIAVVVSERSFRSGEPVTFKVVSSSGREVYYRFGCFPPIVFKVEADTVVALTTHTDDSLPELKVLHPHESARCRWDQRVWQDRKLSGLERFQNFDELAAVPAGSYQLGVEYFLSRDDAEANEGSRTARSEPFTIR